MVLTMNQTSDTLAKILTILGPRSGLMDGTENFGPQPQEKSSMKTMFGKNKKPQWNRQSNLTLKSQVKDLQQTPIRNKICIEKRKRATTV